MDPRIEALPSTTFQGRRFKRKTIQTIKETVELLPGNSRSELALTICEHLNWRSAKGTLARTACLRMLERLEKLDILTLPPKRLNMQRIIPKPVEDRGPETDPAPPVIADIRERAPIALEAVSGRHRAALWNGFVARYHYLGCKRPFGSHLRYFITDVTGRDLGCLMFEDSTKTLPCRDRWIGWTDYQRSRFRHLTVCNSRFLIFPWVRVKYLASMALGMAARQLGDDWLRIHGYRIILAETYVEEPRFKGTCYLAANWMRVGRTVRRSGKARKTVLLRELVPNCRDILCGRKPCPGNRK